MVYFSYIFFFQAEDGIRDLVRSRGLGDVYKRQVYRGGNFGTYRIHHAYNDSIGGAIWNFDFLSTPNAEDLSSSLVVSEDTIVHALVSGNDGFGFPTHAYYLSKSPGAISFSSAADVANGFSAEVGSLSISNNSASCVLNEVSGNIFTGNVIYSEANSGWNAITLLNTQEIYNAQMLIDQNGKGYVAAYQGNTFQTEETIVYGPDFSTGIKNTESGICLLYTSDAADERSSVDLGGRRIIKKKKQETIRQKPI